jgi:hypothetical protein
MNSAQLKAGYFCEPFQDPQEPSRRALAWLDGLAISLSVRLSATLNHPTMHHATWHCLRESSQWADHASHLVSSWLEGDLPHGLLCAAAMVIGMAGWAGPGQVDLLDRPSSSPVPPI